MHCVAFLGLNDWHILQALGFYKKEALKRQSKGMFLNGLQFWFGWFVFSSLCGTVLVDFPRTSPSKIPDISLSFSKSSYSCSLLLSLHLAHSKIHTQKSQTGSHLQISSGLPLAARLKEEFPIGLWGEGIDINQRRDFLILQGNRSEPQMLGTFGGQLPWWRDHRWIQHSLNKETKDKSVCVVYVK